MAMTVHLDIASAEEQLFSGLVEMIIANGTMGELGIVYNHAPLLTSLKPGPVRIVKQGGEEEVFYVSGGMLEVQPYLVTILADSASRADDMDEAAALEAKAEAEKHLKDQSDKIEYSKATVELAEAIAQLRTIQALKKKAKHLK
ncbi:MAG TPA: F0F1 ATP synthase subunit epsilon [Aeromonadales bacterium]|nr:F0F1 ATP synthase subunit epsilon [Aeromonadales bacterium]